MENSWNVTFYETSVNVLQLQFTANVIWTFFCVSGLIMSSLLVVLILSRKQLRNSHQASILTLAFSDILQSVGFGAPGVKRLYLTVNRLPELTSQRQCMLWLFGINTTVLSSLFILLCLSIERLSAVVAPVWFREHHKSMTVAMLVPVVLLSLTIASVGVLMGSDSIPNVACTATQSYPYDFSNLMTYLQNIGGGVVAAINVVTMVALTKRYRQAAKTRTLAAFKRDVELSVLKTLGAVLALFFLLMATSASMVAVVRDSRMTDSQKAAIGPVIGSVHLLRGMVDFWLYLYFGTEYRASARIILNKMHLGFKQISYGLLISVSSSVGSTSSGVNVVRSVAIPPPRRNRVDFRRISSQI